MSWEGNGRNEDEQLENNNFLRGLDATWTAHMITDLLPSICSLPTSWCGPASLLWLCSLLHLLSLCFSNSCAPLGYTKDSAIHRPCQCIWELPPIPLCAVLPKNVMPSRLNQAPQTSQISRESKFVYFLRQSNITQSTERQLKTTSGSCSIIIHP